MTDKKPKDYLMAEVAYNAFYKEQPQIFFDDLVHHHQMKWVEVARRVAAFHDTYRHLKTGKRNFKGSEEQRAQWRDQAKRRRDNLPKKSD